LNNQTKINKFYIERAKTLRIFLLAILFAYVVSERLELHKNAELINDVQSPVEWLQPVSLDKQFPILIGTGNWTIDFSNIQKILWQSKLSATGQLAVDSETWRPLQKISEQLPANLNPFDSQRLTLLIEQCLPGSEGGRIAELVTRYYRYQQEYLANLDLLNKATGKKKLSLLKASRNNNKNRQERHFGVELAKALFDKKNTLTDYLNDRLIINMDKSLSAAQKKEQLMAAKQAYEKLL
jgi:hypothetical protein